MSELADSLQSLRDAKVSVKASRPHTYPVFMRKNHRQNSEVVLNV